LDHFHARTAALDGRGPRPDRAPQHRSASVGRSAGDGRADVGVSMRAILKKIVATIVLVPFTMLATSCYTTQRITVSELAGKPATQFDEVVVHLVSGAQHVFQRDAFSVEPSKPGEINLDKDMLVGRTGSAMVRIPLRDISYVELRSLSGGKSVAAG